MLITAVDEVRIINLGRALRHQPSDDQRRARNCDIAPLNAGGKQHGQKNQEKNQGRVVISLKMDQKHRNRSVQAEQKQIFKALNIVSNLLQMQREGQNKSDFQQFRRLKIDP